MHLIQEIARRNKAGRDVGIYSCCSANRDVVNAVLLKAKHTNTVALIESTSNQVNQLGGYVGMTPTSFHAFCHELAQAIGLPADRLVIGGDHLGPLPWASEPCEQAMADAAGLVRACVMAGYSKIHLDTSMALGGETHLSTATCAQRAAALCAEAEAAFREYACGHPEAEPPVYVLGSEVPIPGGETGSATAQVTRVDDCMREIEEYRRAFLESGVGDVWSRVVGFVVQLGVEFLEHSFHEYDASATHDLVEFMRTTSLVIEGHSTDYQTAGNLKHMCEDGAAILKVGPSLTFSAREALFALEDIERCLLSGLPRRLSHFRDVLERVMVEDDSHWRDYYHGDKFDQKISRGYSFYDRSRYYLSCPEVIEARGVLIANLSGNVIPLGLLSQYLPNQYIHVRTGAILNEAEDILYDRIGDRIGWYLYATKNNGEM